MLSTSGEGIKNTLLITVVFHKSVVNLKPLYDRDGFDLYNLSTGVLITLSPRCDLGIRKWMKV